MLSKCRKDMDHGEYMSNKENVRPAINYVTPTRENACGSNGQFWGDKFWYPHRAITDATIPHWIRQEDYTRIRNTLVCI